MANGVVDAPEESEEPKVEVEEDAKPAVKKRQTRKGKGVVVKEAETDDEFDPSEKQAIPKTKKTTKTKAKSSPKKAAKKSAGVDGEEPPKKPKSQSAASKLTPGITPFPDWPHPTREEAYAVKEVLEKLHGKHDRPANIPKPSLTVAGCGEVKHILDALLRTLLSANTTGKNAGVAIAGLKDTFGVTAYKDASGVAEYYVNWWNVHQADQIQVRDAIVHGGMANMKSKSIKAFLDKAYQESLERADMLRYARTHPDAPLPIGAESMTQEERDLEIDNIEKNQITGSLDYVHKLNPDDAMTTMTSFPGIGVKTASCVILFSMRQPSFAVDTHVHRLCKWLQWVPPQADPVKTFMHCEVKVPDELKYPLHQLLINHGKKCGRCRAVTGESSEGWEAGCVIDHLVTRTGARKGGVDAVKKKRKKGKKSDEDEDTESSDVAVEAEDLKDEEADGDFAEEKPAKRRSGRAAPAKANGNSKAVKKQLEVKSPAKAKKVAARPRAPRKGKKTAVKAEEDGDFGDSTEEPSEAVDRIDGETKMEEA